jgi:hypothetical protein
LASAGRTIASSDAPAALAETAYTNSRFSRVALTRTAGRVFLGLLPPIDRRFIAASNVYRVEFPNNFE